MYDYGPYGCALQNNLYDLWRKFFVLEEEMLEIDSTILTPHDVLKTSGHVDRFEDYMVTDVETGDLQRADHLVEARLEDMISESEDATLKSELNTILAKLDGFQDKELNEVIKKYSLKSDGGNDVSAVVRFNLMFKTSIGPKGNLQGYLRPETAQGHFVNFKKLLDVNNGKLPFASAQIGKSFRNEISPNKGLLRVREFTMAEIEHFCHPDRKDHPKFVNVKSVKMSLLTADTQVSGSKALKECTIGEAVKQGMVDNETLGYYMARVFLFLTKIGIAPSRLRFRQHMSTEMAHYANDCWDAEIHTSFGWIECVGNADRSCYDLTRHTEVTGEKLCVRETLPEAVIVAEEEIQINSGAIGKKFRGEAKAIRSHLEKMSFDEMRELCSGTRNILLSDKEFHVSPEMVKIETVTRKKHVNEFIPSVIEPSFGFGRILYSLLEHSFSTRPEDVQRSVLSFPTCMSPVKVWILPLQSGDDFTPLVQELVQSMKREGMTVRYDSGNVSIGKRYARYDEIGVSFCVTVDFDSVKNRDVTVRERDSMQQIRIPVDGASEMIRDLINGKLQWSNVMKD